MRVSYIKTAKKIPAQKTAIYTSLTGGDGYAMINDQKRESKMTKHHIISPLTPNLIQFESSQKLTDFQLAKLNKFIDELLFEDCNEDSIPEFTTDVEQHFLQ